MPSQTSVMNSVETPASPVQDTAKYDSERKAVIRLMIVMTLIAVALVTVGASWLGVFQGTDAQPGESTSLMSNLTLFGGGAAVLLLSAALVYSWLKLAKRLMRMDWIN